MPKTTKRSTATNRTVTTVSVGSGERVRSVKMPVVPRSPTKRIKLVSQSQARYKSDLFESIHSSASDLHAVGAIGKQTMREYDELCIEPPKELSARAIKRLREGLNMSQPIFARRIYVSPSTVAKWESGANKPSGIALKYLNVLKRLGAEALD
jgi:putative transcriptional regulator